MKKMEDWADYIQKENTVSSLWLLKEWLKTFLVLLAAVFLWHTNHDQQEKMNFATFSTIVLVIISIIYFVSFGIIVIKIYSIKNKRGNNTHQSSIENQN